MGAQDVKYLAIGSFVMLVVYAPVIFGIYWAVSGGLLSATVGYLGAVGGVHPVVSGRACIHLRPPRRLGRVD